MTARYRFQGPGPRRREGGQDIDVDDHDALLAWDARRTTRDVDGLFVTDRHQDLIEACQAVARLLGLPASWMNEQASAYAPRDHHPGAGTVYDGTHLRVLVARAEAVLAMKVRAFRLTDVPDIEFLVGHAGLGTLDEVMAVHDRYFPDDPLPEPKRERLAALMDVR